MGSDSLTGVERRPGHGFGLLCLACSTFMACGETDTPPVDGALPEAIVYAAGTDYMTTGMLSTIELPSLQVGQDVVAGVVSSDPVLRSYDGKLYIINRYGFDNVSIVDPSTGQLIQQISTGNGTNPQDVAVKGSKLYVAALEAPGIIVLDMDRPDSAPAIIDLSTYDPDGIPNLNSVFIAGDRLFATMVQYDATFTSFAGRVVVVDTVTDMVETDFELTYDRPLGLLQPAPADSDLAGDLLITTTEEFDAGAGCVERISTGGTPGSRGCLVENAALGGYATAIQVADERVWLAVSTSVDESKLISVSSAGALDESSLTAPSQQPTDLTICPTGHIVANDVKQGGLRVFSREGDELTTGSLDIGLPPAFTNGLICRSPPRAR